jgi:hypothetical protein
VVVRVVVEILQVTVGLVDLVGEVKLIHLEVQP